MIAAENLSYSYASARRAVGTGEIVGFLGTNRAGKSAPPGPYGPYAMSPGKLYAIRMRA